MQITEAHLGYHMASVNADTAERFGYPYRVACEDLIVFRCTGKLYAAQLHDEVVNELLNLLLGKCAVCKVSLRIAVKEGGRTSKGHCSTVLLFYGAEITEVSPLDRFLYVRSRLGNVAAVRSSHLLHHL